MFDMSKMGSSGRTGLLQSLVQVQGDFETSSRDLLWGLQELWIQLEELHTGVTLSKQEGRGHRDLTSVETDAEVSWYHHHHC